MRSTAYLLLFLSALFTACPARAESARDFVAAGNESYAAGEYDKALEAYENAAAERPESGEVFFNKGDAHFRKGQYDKARDAYQSSALNTKDLSLEAAAHYNMGNAIFAEGQSQLQTNPQKTLSLFEQSIQHYREALRIDPHLEEAAQNIELARIAMKELADKLKETKEASKEQQKQSDDMNKQQDDKTAGEKERNDQDQSPNPQEAGENGKEEPGDKEQQKTASEDQPGEEKKEGGKPDQQQSAAQEDGRSAEKEEGQKGDEQKADGLFSESPEDILREEKDNRLQLYRAPKGGQKPVEKDW